MNKFSVYQIVSFCNLVYQRIDLICRVLSVVVHTYHDISRYVL